MEKTTILIWEESSYNKPPGGKPAVLCLFLRIACRNRVNLCDLLAGIKIAVLIGFCLLCLQDMFYIYPKHSMYGIFTNIWLIFMQHVGKHTIHWVIYPGMLPVPVLVTETFKKVNRDPDQKIWHLLGKDGIATCIYIQKYRWWKKSGGHQLRLVVYHIIYRVSKNIQTVVVWDFWTINLIMP